MHQLQNILYHNKMKNGKGYYKSKRMNNNDNHNNNKEINKNLYQNGENVK